MREFSPFVSTFARAGAAAILGLIAFAPDIANAQARILKEVTCPRTAPPGTDYVTVVLDLEKIESNDTDDGALDGTFEYRLTASPRVFEIDAQGKQKKNYYCNEAVVFNFERPIPNLIYGGRVEYTLPYQVRVVNVPKSAAVYFNLFLREEDNLGDDFGDLDPSPTNDRMNGTWIALIPATGTGIAYSSTIFNKPVDIMAGKRKRIVGDGRGTDIDFTAGLEFTFRVEDQIEIGGAVKKPVTADTIGTAVIPTAPGLFPDPKVICDAYSKTAVSQFQSVQPLTDCTFLPPVWSGDPLHHYNWCMQAENYKLADAGTALREQQIKVCTGN